MSKGTLLQGGHAVPNGPISNGNEGLRYLIKGNASLQEGISFSWKAYSKLGLFRRAIKDLKLYMEYFPGSTKLAQDVIKKIYEGRTDYQLRNDIVEGFETKRGLELQQSEFTPDMKDGQTANRGED